MQLQLGLQRMKMVGALKSNAPAAWADVLGDEGHRSIHGRVNFYPVGGGTLVEAVLFGLPYTDSKCPGGVFGFHIHEGRYCTGTKNDPFADAGGHYNPKGCPHPEHAGDMPVLFGNKGYAWMAFYTDRFIPQEVVGRTVIVHAGPDDFKTQPSGNSGAKIACGEIREA